MQGTSALLFPGVDDAVKTALLVHVIYLNVTILRFTSSDPFKFPQSMIFMLGINIHSVGIFSEVYITRFGKWTFDPLVRSPTIWCININEYPNQLCSQRRLSTLNNKHQHPNQACSQRRLSTLNNKHQHPNQACSQRRLPTLNCRSRQSGLYTLNNTVVRVDFTHLITQQSEWAFHTILPNRMNPRLIKTPQLIFVLVLIFYKHSVNLNINSLSEKITANLNITLASIRQLKSTHHQPRDTYVSMKNNVILCTILLLCGDIEINPGPRNKT